MVWRVASRLPHLAADSLPSPGAPFMRCLMDSSSDVCCGISRRSQGDRDLRISARPSSDRCIAAGGRSN